MVLRWSRKKKHFRFSRPRLGMLQLRWHCGRLARARLIHSPPSSRSGSEAFASPPCVSPFSGLSLALPSLAATTGRAAASFVTSSPSPLPATSTLQVCPPRLFLSSVRDGAPQTLTKLFVFGSESSYNILVLPTNFDFVCKNYRVYMCTPMPYAGSAPDFWCRITRHSSYSFFFAKQ